MSAQFTEGEPLTTRWRVNGTYKSRTGVTQGSWWRTVEADTRLTAERLAVREEQLEMIGGQWKADLATAQPLGHVRKLKGGSPAKVNPRVAGVLPPTKFNRCDVCSGSGVGRGRKICDTCAGFGRLLARAPSWTAPNDGRRE